MRKKLKAFFILQQSIRNFFLKEGFIDVICPPLVENPGMETHIHPFTVQSIINKNSVGYLHTSPEFKMKELLSLEFSKIFTIGYCFRDEPKSDHHRNQFLMLEWYRAGERYEKIMDDSQRLINYCHSILNPDNQKEIIFKKKTVQEIFKEVCNIDIYEFLDTKDFEKLIRNSFPEVPLPKEYLSWDDLFFLLFLNKVEPEIRKIPFLILYEYPASQAALATIKKNDPKVCERFEIYINGIEICNCFNELTDIEEQKRRFNNQQRDKKQLFKYQLPSPDRFYNTMEKGLPPSSGIALGIERLLMALSSFENPFWD